MSEISIVFGAYERTGDPTLVARNVFAEQVETAQGPKLQLRARPGLETFVKVGAGPLRGIAQKDGLFGGAAIVISRTTVYTLTAGGVSTPLTGAVPGDGLVDIALGQDADLNSVAYIATGAGIYKAVNGVVSLDATFPEDGATSCDYIGGYFIAVATGTDKFYYLPPGVASWAPLDFASAEYAPDPLVFVRARGDQIAFGGSATFQVFTLSGVEATPVVPYGGLNEDYGARSLASAVNCAGSLMFVDSRCNVRRWEGGEPGVVSSPGLAEQIAKVDAEDLVGWSFSVPGHRFYVLKLGDQATWVYDLESPGERWTTFDSLGFDYWRAQIGCNIGGTVLACDASSAQVYRLNSTTRMDGDQPFGVEFCAVIAGAEVRQPLSNVVLLSDLGDAPRVGEGSEPTIQLQWSDNQGKTFSGWRERPMGQTGVYGVSPRWNALGTVPAFFGRILRFRCSDPIGRVFRRVLVNV